MNLTKLKTLDQLRAFLAGTSDVEFRSAAGGAEDRYRHIARVLARFRYKCLRKPDKGLVLRYLERTTGYSRQQLTRLVGRWCAGEVLSKRYQAPERGWTPRFTEEDVALLAETDAKHNTLSGPATVHLMRRALKTYGDCRYERLATISVGHLYNLRKKRGYLARRKVYTTTRPTGIAIGVRYTDAFARAHPVEAGNSRERTLQIRGCPGSAIGQRWLKGCGQRPEKADTPAF